MSDILVHVTSSAVYGMQGDCVPSPALRQEDKSTLIQQYMNDIFMIVKDDVYEDGFESESEAFILKHYSDSTKEFIKPALVNL